jgi:hypothetical protein
MIRSPVVHFRSVQMSRVTFAVVAMISTAALQAQVIYEPVQYQFSDGRNSFFYGGDDARLLDAGFRNLALQRELADVGRPSVGGMVYSDLIGWRDARIFGLTATTAYNDAFANQPRYFRKSELLESAIDTPHGRVVPANAPGNMTTPPGMIVIRSVDRPATLPARPILVLPKSLFDEDRSLPALDDFDISAR